MAGLYIHIPFCESKCAYCDFYSGAAGAEKISEMLDALKREMRVRHETITGGKLSTIYIGGGTPTLLAPQQLQSLLDTAAALWDCSQLREVTVEANPEDLTDEYITKLAGTGFNRLSIGVQSFDEGMLRLMNRRHSADRARDAVRKAQRAGFGNITIDLIYGVPGMTPDQWELSLDEAVALGVQHISAYHLTIEPGTAFGRMERQGKIVPVPEAESERQYEILRRKLGDAGFGHYEISNFARPGFRAVHNSSYWSGEPYLGVGPSAHSFDGKTRSWVVADTKKYIAGAGTEAVYESETLSPIERLNEMIMTSLRTAEGIDMKNMERSFGKDATENLLVRAERFIEDGSMALICGNLAIKPEKFLLSDYIISTLFALS